MEERRGQGQRDSTNKKIIKKALIEGPTTGVPRQSFTFRQLVLTPFVCKKLTRGAGTTTVRKVFQESGVQAKWEASAWAQRRAAISKRRETSDFERFNLLLIKKQRRRSESLFSTCLYYTISVV